MSPSKVLLPTSRTAQQLSFVSTLYLQQLLGDCCNKSVLAYDKAELANLLLCMCPKSWQDRYNLMQELLPRNIRKLSGVLENIEKCVANSNAKDKAVKESTEKATGKGKQKGTNPNEF